MSASEIKIRKLISLKKNRSFECPITPLCAPIQLPESSEEIVKPKTKKRKSTGFVKRRSVRTEDTQIGDVPEFEKGTSERKKPQKKLYSVSKCSRKWQSQLRSLDISMNSQKPKTFDESNWRRVLAAGHVIATSLKAVPK